MINLLKTIANRGIEDECSAPERALGIVRMVCDTSRVLIM